MFELLLATNFPLWSWALGFGLLIAIGTLFIFLYKMTSSYSQIFSFSRIAWLLPCVGLIYIPIKKNLNASPSLSIHQAKVLPFKTLLINKNLSAKDLVFNKVNQPTQSLTGSAIGQNLYMFIVESLRDDAINQRVAPHISEIGQQYIRHPFCIASANGTHLSWYSLFFSQMAIKWKNQTIQGSPLLKDLKQKGYKICVLSSARMSYYAMDKLIFGEDYEYIDHYFCPKIRHSLSAYEADFQCFEQMKEKLGKYEA
jgi:hypothetical protein